MTETTTWHAHPAISEWHDHWAAFYDLSGNADCSSPDRCGDDPSPGALLLNGVRDGIFELIERADLATRDDVERLDDAGSVHEIADNAPDVYTHARWSEFVDLGAYNEDLTEWGPIDPEDIERGVAGVALYQIADRLARAMLDDLAERLENYEPDDDEPDDDDA